MRHAHFAEVDLQEMWSAERPDIRSRSAYLTHWMTGSKSAAAVYFEVDPGASFGRHYHSAEEIIVVIDGKCEVRVGEEVAMLEGSGLAVVPALVRHDIRCVGESTARCVGFWPSSSVVSIWDEVLQPRGSRRAGTPLPEGI